jgi:hypothetical protein
LIMILPALLWLLWIICQESGPWHGAENGSDRRSVVNYGESPRWPAVAGISLVLQKKKAREHYRGLQKQARERAIITNHGLAISRMTRPDRDRAEHWR